MSHAAGWSIVKRTFVLAGMAVVLASCGAFSSVGLGGNQPAGWVVRVDPPDLDSRVLPLLVEERACASGARADGRVRVDVEESATEVRITVSVRRLTGAQGCPGNPLTPVAVTLDQPVGDRLLIDGATGLVPAVDGFGDLMADPVIVRGDEQAVAVVVPVSERLVGHGFWVEPRCELEGSLEESYLPEWRPPGEFGDAGAVLSVAVAELGLSGEGWHSYRRVDVAGREGWTWVQYLEGRPVAVVNGYPAMMGWSGTALACGDLPTGWVPDPAPPADPQPPEPPTAARLNLESVLPDVEALTRVGDEWVFDDPDRRCGAWVNLEDRIEDAGYVIAQTIEHGQWPTDAPAGQTVIRQVSALITDSDGHAAVITTTGPNALVILDATVTGAVEAPSGWSYLSPCHLDRPIEVKLLG